MSRLYAILTILSKHFKLNMLMLISINLRNDKIILTFDHPIAPEIRYSKKTIRRHLKRFIGGIIVLFNRLNVGLFTIRRHFQDFSPRFNNTMNLIRFQMEIIPQTVCTCSGNACPHCCTLNMLGFNEEINLNHYEKLPMQFIQGIFNRLVYSLKYEVLHHITSREHFSRLAFTPNVIESIESTFLSIEPYDLEIAKRVISKFFNELIYQRIRRVSPSIIIRNQQIFDLVADILFNPSERERGISRIIQHILFLVMGLPSTTLIDEFVAICSSYRNKNPLCIENIFIVVYSSI